VPSRRPYSGSVEGHEGPAAASGERHSGDARAPRPPGVVALSLFFWFGTAMSGLAALALSFPGSGLDVIWRMNPTAEASFAEMGAWAEPLMAAVCVACAVSAIGLWRGARWGQRTALVVLAAQLVGDLGNVAIRGDLRTLVGLPIGGAMIAYLLSRRVRRYLHGNA
jgi:hypothetical protein